MDKDVSTMNAPHAARKTSILMAINVYRNAKITTLGMKTLKNASAAVPRRSFGMVKYVLKGVGLISSLMEILANMDVPRGNTGKRETDALRPVPQANTIPVRDGVKIYAT